MKSQMNYKTKRNVIIIAIVVILVILASVGIYSYIKGNSETQAMSEVNGTSAERAGEDVQVAQENNQDNNNGNVSEEPEEQTVEVTQEATDEASEEADDNNEVVTPVTENNTDNTDNDNNSTPARDNNSDNDGNTQNYVQNVTTTDEVETTETIVGFRTENLDYDLSGVSAIIPDREPPTVTIKAERRTDNGREEITGDTTNSGSIYFTFTWSEPVEGFTREDISYEGFDHKESNELKEIEPGLVYEYILYTKKDAEVVTTMTVHANSVTDLAGNYNENDTVRTIKVDTKAPEYINMGIFNWTNDNDGDPDRTEDKLYATNGSHIRLFVTFPEMLEVNPKVDIYGKDGKVVATYELKYNGVEFYYVEFDISPEWDLPEGKIKYKVYGYADEVGNVGKDLTEEDTLSKENPYVIFDKTAPGTGNSFSGFPLYILNITANNEEDIDKYPTHYQYIQDGKTLKIEANFTEKLDPYTTPVVTIKNGENVLTGNLVYREKLGDKYRYTVDIKFDNDTLKLQDGQRVEFTITNVRDIAGNYAEFNNDNVTKYYRNNVLVYDQVTYDETAPQYTILRLHNDTHYNNGGDLHFATNGDSIRFGIHFDEKLSVEPTLVLEGDGPIELRTFTMTFRPDSSKTDYEYMADVKLTSEMGLPQGEIKFKVYGYEDAAGNAISKENALTEENVNHDTYNGVEYDTIAPKYQTLGILNTTNMNESEDVNYAKDGDNVRVLVWFKEKLAVEPKISILTNDGYVELEGDNTFKYSNDGRENVHYYVANFKVTPEMNLPQGEIQFKVYGYEDAAGIVGDELTNKDINRTDYTKVIYDSKAPKFIGIQNGHFYQDDVVVNVEDDNIASVQAVVYETGKTIDIIKNGYILKTDSIYKLIAKDRAGNETVVYVGVDKHNPEFTTLKNGHQYNKDVAVKVKDLKVKSIKVYYYEDKTTKEIENGAVLSKEGTYKIVATDYAGRATTIYIEIDKTAPTFDNLVNGTSAESISLRGIDSNFDYILLINQDTGETIKESREWTSFGGKERKGTWTAQVFDKAGNSSDVYTFTITAE